MTHPPDALAANTPDATRAEAQRRDRAPTLAPPDTMRRPAMPDEGLGRDYRLGDGVTRRPVRPYAVRAEDPLYRPLRIYTLDPGESRAVGAEAVLNVPWEPLAPGPVGRLLAVDGADQGAGVRYAPVDLDDPRLLLEQGLPPTPADARFHQQMTYAVCSTVYHTFRRALGRDPSWGFTPRRAPPDAVSDGIGDRLRILPYAMADRNAYYDKADGTLRFGYYDAAPRVGGTNLPGGLVFTALSHDIVAHEMTHALLDGLRAHFALPTGPDVLAFHEALADLVAVFQHFSYPQVVRAALRQGRGDLRGAALLVDIGRQFGHTTGGAEGAPPLRTAFDVRGAAAGSPRRYDPDLPTHELGSVLVEAVFAAFAAVYDRKTERYRLLATGGTGVLPPGELPSTLADVLADEASRLASQFLAICIRAVDYCPPVDVEFGEYLRALITADRDVVRDDRWRYRELLVAAFRERDIHPRGVRFLAEDALLWSGPRLPLPAIPELSFAELRFRGDPGQVAGRRELRRQACALGRLVTRPEHLATFGLAPAGRGADGVTALPCVESVRASRRVGPDGQVVFDLVAEVTQRRLVDDPAGRMAFYGGATVILDPEGRVRIVVSKRIDNDERLARQRAYVAGAGARYWTRGDGERRPSPAPFHLTHTARGRAG
jgi:hypothetical protein